MSDQITPIPKIRAAAEEAVLAGKPIGDRPGEFHYMEEAWIDAYMCAYFGLNSKVAA